MAMSLATKKPVELAWEPAARRYYEQRRQPQARAEQERTTAAAVDAGEATPIDITSWASELVIERNLAIAGAAVGVGVVIGWWWKRRKKSAATIAGARYSRLPAWAH